MLVRVRKHPSIVSTVRTVWKLVVSYTLLAFRLLFGVILTSDSEYAASLSLSEVTWQALNHAMTGLTTGGVSVTDNSIVTYNSPLVEAVLLPIMILGAIAFPIHYLVLREGQWRKLIEDVRPQPGRRGDATVRGLWAGVREHRGVQVARLRRRTGAGNRVRGHGESAVRL